jgi:hypothetical protein
MPWEGTQGFLYEKSISLTNNRGEVILGTLPPFLLKSRCVHFLSLIAQGRDPESFPTKMPPNSAKETIKS